ncbi:conserved hypothetical protein [Rhodopseudomonas palustris HaA2]|uniref:Uncharacterized protein n=1 Tax=Rhodopseudomonas palustris (strain HaA2) TaxID=316058 RepID=Q2J3A3_RHOP2|nr:hypothetical protein [Rhodopseudomonas palustris]ABD05057.1 conserved hypothetical protein [Rhodopseudomonas palustris HaA2]
MRCWIAATIVAAVLGAMPEVVMPAVAAQPSTVSAPRAAQAGEARAMAATEFSARHRGRAHAHRQARRFAHRHPRRGAHQRYVAPRYDGRPSYYRPYDMAPFFPFGFGGYGLQPSW